MGSVNIVYSLKLAKHCLKCDVGGEPSFSVTKGYFIIPEDLTERGVSVLLSVIESSTTPSTRPKLVTITTNAIDDRLYSLLPLPLKAFYSWGLRIPLADKVNQEKVVKHAAGWDGDGMGWLGAKNMVVVRPSILTFGECMADKGGDAYRVGQELGSAWTVSRADVAHFVAERVITNWDEWAGEAWVVSY